MSDLGAATWSETDASNTASPPNGWPEGMFPSDVNNSARANMGGEKRWWVRSNSVFTTAGSSTVYTLTYAVAAAAYYDGEEFSFIVDETCGAAPTLNINGLGARNLRKFVSGGWTNLAAGDIVATQPIRVRYNLADTKFDIVSFASNTLLPGTSAGNATTFLAADVALNNTANFFSGPNTGSIGSSGQTWLLIGVADITDAAAGAAFEAAIFDGTNYIANSVSDGFAAGARVTITICAIVTLAGATTFTLRAKDRSGTTGFLLTSSVASGVTNKATSITAMRIA